MTVQAISPPTILMRRATRADLALLLEFYHRYFADRPRLNDSALWNWEFSEQPADRGELPFFVLDSGNRIEGGIGLIRFNIRAGTHILAGVHPVNYFVNPDFKGLHALRLFRSALSEAPVVLGSYISGDAMPLVKLSGFLDLSRHFYAYHFSLRRSRSAATAMNKLRNALVVFTRRLWLATSCGLTRLGTPNIHYRVTDKLDTRWLARSESWRLAECGIVKSSTYLAWRYAASPALNCRFVWQLRGETPIALAVIHLDSARGEAVLLDCIAEKDDFWLLLGLVCQTMRFAYQTGAELWSTHALSMPLKRVLRILGCSRRQSPFGVNVRCEDNSLREYISDPHRWHFMVGDTDVY